MNVRVLGLGNPILTDDAVGIAVVRRLKKTGGLDDVEIREVESGGMDLLGHLEGCDGAVIVDSIITGTHKVGEVFESDLEDLPVCRRMRGAHDADLGSLLEMGRNLGLAMPRAVKVVAVEIADNMTFGERMTEAVADAVAPAAEIVNDNIIKMIVVCGNKE